MWREQGFPTNRPRVEPVGGPAAVMIQVPAVRERPSRRWRPATELAPRGRSRRRRRLRREVRMIGSALALGALIAVPLLLAGGIRPRSWQAQVQRTTRATGDDVSGGRDGLGPAGLPSSPMAVELDAPVAAPEEVPLAFPGYLLPGDEHEEARRAGS